MGMLTVLGATFACIMFFFIPRTIGPLALLAVLGGGVWCWLFIPIAIVGFVVDLASMAD